MSVYIVGIAVAVIAVGFFVLWIGRWRGASVDEEDTAAAAEAIHESPENPSS